MSNPSEIFIKRWEMGKAEMSSRLWVGEVDRKDMRCQADK